MAEQTGGLFLQDSNDLAGAVEKPPRTATATT